MNFLKKLDGYPVIRDIGAVEEEVDEDEAMAMEEIDRLANEEDPKEEEEPVEDEEEEDDEEEEEGENEDDDSQHSSDAGE